MSKLPTDNADAMALIKTYVEKTEEARRLRNETDPETGLRCSLAMMRARTPSLLASMAAAELHQQYDIDVDEMVDGYHWYVHNLDEQADIKAQRAEVDTGLDYFAF